MLEGIQKPNEKTGKADETKRTGHLGALEALPANVLPELNPNE